MINMRLFHLLLLFSLFIALPALSAQERTPESIRKRMEVNLPKIDALKKSGKVGENYKGYLEARAPLDAAEKALVKAENSDRKSVYELLAQRAKTTLEQIERTRAELIRKRSVPGVWLQDESKEWYRKPAGP
jgi:uncharacterized protein